MKRVVTVLTISANAALGLGLLAATSFKPVQATTFPTLTLIYVAAGAVDRPNPFYIGTSVSCTNQSGQTATVRWRFLTKAGAETGSRTAAIPNGRTQVTGTSGGTTAYSDNGSGAFDFEGKVAVYSTQSAVFCSANVGSSNNTGAIDLSGHALHMVRFNPHPGTVE